MKYLVAALIALCLLVVIGIGRVSYASDSLSRMDTKLNAAAASTVLAATQTPQSDGTIIHTVRTGETIESIAAAYHVSVQQIRDYNSIPTGGVSTGQRLLISISYPTTQPANATFLVVTSTNTPNPTVVKFVIVTATFTPNPNQPTATPKPPTATATPTLPPASPTPPPTLAAITSTGSVCITGFADVNTNHWFDSSEARLPGIRIKLAQASGTAQGGQALTTAADNATCFNNLPVGAFIVDAAAPDGYGFTTPPELTIDLTAGAQLTLSFGAAPGYQPPAAGTGASVPVTTSTSTPAATGILTTVKNNSGFIVLAIALVILIGGLGVVALARRL